MPTGKQLTLGNISIKCLQIQDFLKRLFALSQSNNLYVSLANNGKFTIFPEIKLYGMEKKKYFLSTNMVTAIFIHTMQR